MIRYKLYKNTNEKSAQYGKWYARSVVQETLDTQALAEHMSTHNSPYSEGVINGVLTDMIRCIKELVLGGKAVKLDDLAIFSLDLKTTGAATVKDFSVADNIQGVRLRARATGKLSTANLNLAAQYKQQATYSLPDDSEQETGQN